MHSERSAAQPSPSRRFLPWPPGTRAAVSLTYDDGLSSHYRTAAAQLAQAKLRGTFFLNEVRKDEPWVQLARAGHELGAHTQHHPCPRDQAGSARASEDYDLPAIVAELDGDVRQLMRLGQAPPYSFAYPCGVSWFGPDRKSYVQQVRERFASARTADPIESSTAYNPHLVPAHFGLDTAEALLRAVDRAVEQGEWLVLGFHGIGQDYLVTEAEVHGQFVEKLSTRSDVWVAPFGEIAEHLRQELKI
jgi:peptidoglycan/xylan/chitin deacetylase (PgdA/CDA1 family)